MDFPLKARTNNAVTKDAQDRPDAHITQATPFSTSLAGGFGVKTLAFGVFLLAIVLIMLGHTESIVPEAEGLVSGDATLETKQATADDIRAQREQDEYDANDLDARDIEDDMDAETVLNSGTASNTLQPFYGDKFNSYKCSTHRHKTPGTLPSFMVAGVHKGGSTAIYSYLMQHGFIRPSSCKETLFFSVYARYKQGMTFYRKHFPDLTETPWVTTGEGTPTYIRHPTAPLRIREVLPNIKAIVSLRNPVDRFISHYIGPANHNPHDLDCDDYFANDVATIQSCMDDYTPEGHVQQPIEIDGVNAFDALRMFVSPTELVQILGKSVRRSPKSRSDITCNRGETQCIRRYCLWKKWDMILTRSLYVDQIVRWIRVFPPEQLYIVQAEQLYMDVPKTMQDIVAYLGLRPFTDDEMKKFAKSKTGSSHHSSPKFKSCTRPPLTKFFATENALLYGVLKSQFPQTWASWRQDLWAK
mmetsp:Transcript_20583/g.40427  ORF Transcript_20583/g.40427 Transcript_20583/m.40427 type:complete len:472 (-) Transcript_20583:363-1778(-)